jgi:hypothetical protein
MKPFFLALLLLAGYASALFAQNDEPVIVLSTTGKVFYTAPATAKAVEVFPGALLRPQGTIQVRKKGQVTLQYRKRIIQSNATTPGELATLFQEAGSSRALGFESRFTQAVEDAFVMAYLADDPAEPWSRMGNRKGMGDGWGIKGDSRDTSASAPTVRTGDGWTIKGDSRDTSASAPVRTGDGWGIKGDSRDTSASAPVRTGDGWGIKGDSRDTSASAPVRTGDGWGIKGDSRDTSASAPSVGTGDGWGGGQTELKAVYPFGLISAGEAVFHWTGTNGKETCVVEVLDQEGRTRAKGTSTSSPLRLQLSETQFEEGETYVWRVRVPGVAARSSQSLSLKFTGPQARAAVLERVGNSAIYASSTADVQALMRATALVQAECYGDAIAEFQLAENLQGKTGQSARLMQAAFWKSLGLQEAAISGFARKWW